MHGHRQNEKKGQIEIKGLKGVLKKWCNLKYVVGKWILIISRGQNTFLAKSIGIQK